jgi:hypothetical protein
MFAAVWKVASVNGFRTGWQGVPIYLALAGICGRIANCKVLLRENELLLINPLRTHIVPKVLIRGASIGDDGTLSVDLGGNRTVSAFAFGGSLVDRFRGTSGEARQKINSWLLSSNAVSNGETHTQIRWTRCAPADFSLILCVVTASVGAMWMALS